MEMAIDTPSPAPPTPPAPSAAAGRQTRAAESVRLEHQLVRVPLEALRSTVRSNNRLAEKEIAAVLSSASAAPAESSAAAVDHLTSLVSRLHGLKRKMEEGARAEELQVQRCRARLDRLATASTGDDAEWEDMRLKRILVDYMLRMSYYDSASKLAETSGIQDLVDIDVFLDAKRVINSLQNNEVAPALAWCAENKSRLKKSKSKLEFLLRLQEFVEFVKAKNCIQAIAYARKYLAPWGSIHMKELQRVTATLVFRSNTNCAPYKILFEQDRWDFLIDMFKQDFCKFYGMTLEPLLNIYLQAGLTALKTPFCTEGSCPKEDPLSLEGFRKLAEPLPFSKQHHSKLVCYITKELMDTENPPRVLPNGYVYSEKALQEMAKKNDGKITCPRTGEVCDFSECVRAFIS
ncbi:Macrophage erythroblast attacher [Dichanthelium oligosanthes]|uniref:Macrophage erythroblast attacher n=1 Tax=Dichanthelium oligosanthes TaxID=888268 RepID=A0A1E5V0T9_9POAL|nr:Macrophage erythroblast attacher [Dichanthelium oligosanthes]